MSEKISLDSSGLTYFFCWSEFGWLDVMILQRLRSFPR